MLVQLIQLLKKAEHFCEKLLKGELIWPQVKWWLKWRDGGHGAFIWLQRSAGPKWSH